MWQIVCGHSPRLLPKMSRRQRLSYLLLQPFYPSVAVQWLLSIALTTAYMITGANLGIPGRAWALFWCGSLASVTVFWLWAHKFNLEAHSRRPGLTGMALMLMTIPVYCSAGLRWVSGRGLPYVITAKGDQASPDRLRTFRPHLAWLGWVAGLLVLAGAGVLHAWPVVLFWVGVTVAICSAPLVIHLGSRLRRAPAVAPVAAPVDRERELVAV